MMRRSISILLVLLLSASAFAVEATFQDLVLDGREGEVHYLLHVPQGEGPFGLFVTLPGYEGLRFQGAGENLRREDFAWQALEDYGPMIVLAPQLSDWHERSARQTIELTQYILDNYDVDRSRVWLEGYSGGGETGSLVMGMRPDLYTAFLAVSTRWDGDLEVLASWRRPVYMAVGEDDSWYGSEPLVEAASRLRDIYARQGLDEGQIDRLVTLDVRPQSFFTDAGYRDQHAGGNAFAFDDSAMLWLFSQRLVKGEV